MGGSRLDQPGIILCWTVLPVGTHRYCKTGWEDWLECQDENISGESLCGMGDIGARRKLRELRELPFDRMDKMDRMKT